MIQTINRSHTIQLLEKALRHRHVYTTAEGSEFKCYYGTMGEAPMAKFSLTLLPANRRVLISHGLEVAPCMRGQGLGRKLLNLREECAIEAGCNLLLATVRNDNAVEIHLLETSGWQRFTNRPETGVSLWGKQI